MNRLVLFFFSILLLGLISCSSDEEGTPTTPDPTPDKPITNADPAPDFDLITFDDFPLRMSDYQEQNLVIFFFGNSCPPCQAVGPDIESQLNEAFKEKENYSIIGIDQWDGNAASVEAFRDRTGINFPLGLMGSGVARQFGTTYDRLVVVNAEANIIYRGNSIAANNLDEVVALVTDLLD